MIYMPHQIDIWWAIFNMKCCNASYNCFMGDCFILSFEDLCTYLQQLQRERKWERKKESERLELGERKEVSSICSLLIWPQHPRLSRPKARAYSGTPMWVAWIQTLRPFSTVVPRSLTRNLMGSRCGWNDAHVGCQFHSHHLYLL